MINLRGNNGSVTLFVITTCLFFVVAVTLVGMNMQAKKIAVDREYKQIKENYEKDVSNISEIYEKLKQTSNLEVIFSDIKITPNIKQISVKATLDTQNLDIKTLKYGWLYSDNELSDMDDQDITDWTYVENYNGENNVIASKKYQDSQRKGHNYLCLMVNNKSYWIEAKVPNMPEGWVVADETNLLNDWYAYQDTTTVSGEVATVNAPKLAEGMTPIKYLGEEDTSNSSLEAITSGSQWANAMTKDGSMWVWVPRYAYSIVNGYQTSTTETPAQTNAKTEKNIEIKFLVGTTNVDRDGTEYATDYDPETEVVDGVTPMIVHPAFKLGNENLTGIWVAKFEASGTKTVESDGKETEVAVGNHTNGTTLVEPETTTPVKSVPNAISWRNITIGESQYRCMQMSSNTDVYGWSNVNTHLIRNSEWGAVSYLCYSKYGSVPMINGCGSFGTNWYDFYTGMGPTSSSSEERYEVAVRNGHEYNTTNGILASTTGNVYGIYDMSGGSWERVAAYLNNGNGNLNTYGKSTTDSSIKYFEGGVINSDYSSLWEKYEVGEEEKNNSIRVTENGVETYINKDSLWNVSKTAETYVEARRRITEATFNNLASHKGIGINEMSLDFSFYTPFNYLQDGETKSTWGWFVKVSTVLNRATGTSTTNEYARSWNNDLVLIGHASSPFVLRGGYVNSGTDTGVLYSNITSGSNSSDKGGFRAALCL